MSYYRFLLASALVPAALFAFPSSPEAAALSHGHASAADYTHIHTSTLSAEPASHFIDMSHSYKTAAVCFLGYGDCGDAGFGSMGGDDGYQIDTAQQCQNEGFSWQNCNSVQVIDGVCPYNSSFGKGCKCADGLVSCSEGQTGVGESCGGKYAKCECVAGVSAGAYGCKEYYGSPCSSVCKTAYTDNCHNRNDNNSAVYGCMKYWDDCSTKCETPYTDNCRNRTAVISSCPVNATCTYFSDCSAKISGWSCKSGYTKSGNSCVIETEPCNVGSIYYADGTCLSAENHNADRTVLGIVVYMTNDGQHGQIMAPWWIDTNGNRILLGVDITMTWGLYHTDIPELPNMTNRTLAEADFDSCGNTDKIVAAGSASDYPAAWATRKYAPTSATAGKWCLPAAGILRNIQKNWSAINTSVNKVGGASDLGNYRVWSSSEGSIDNTWIADLNSSVFYGNSKNYSGSNVLPVLEF